MPDIFYLILTELQFSLPILIRVNVRNVKHHENPSGGSGGFPRGHTDGQTDEGDGRYQDVLIFMRVKLYSKTFFKVF